MCGMANVPDLPEQKPVQPPALRASDADRERVAEILRTAAAEGRLDLGELDERLAIVYAAKTYAELEPVVADLPAAARTVSSAPLSRVGGAPTSSGGVGTMGGVQRKGPWGGPALVTGLAVR